MPSNVDIFDVMNMISQGALENVWTTLPAKIVTYDHETQKAVVQPLIKYRARDGDNNPDGLADMALISSVLVVQPSTPEGIVSFPIKAGWNVWLHFCSRSLDNYGIGDGENPIDPKDYRVHQYSDCFATIGATTFPNAIGSDPSDFVIRFNVGTEQECKVSMEPSGKIKMVSPIMIETNSPDVVVNATNSATVNTEVATITASDNVTIDSPQTTITGELRVDQGISVGDDVQTDSGVSLISSKVIGNLGKLTSPLQPI